MWADWIATLAHSLDESPCGIGGGDGEDNNHEEGDEGTIVEATLVRL